MRSYLIILFLLIFQTTTYAKENDKIYVLSITEHSFGVGHQSALIFEKTKVKFIQNSNFLFLNQFPINLGMSEAENSNISNELLSKIKINYLDLKKKKTKQIPSPHSLIVEISGVLVPDGKLKDELISNFKQTSMKMKWLPTEAIKVNYTKGEWHLENLIDPNKKILSPRCRSSKNNEEICTITGWGHVFVKTN